MLIRSVRTTLSILCLGLAPGLLGPCTTALAEDYQRVLPLLDSGETNLGQPLRYPDAHPAKVQSLIVSMQPGEETGTHRHPHPTYGFIIEGEVTVSYPGGVDKTYRQGEAFLEAVDVWHNGRNTGTSPLQILAIFMGAEGEPNVIRPKTDAKD